MNGFSPVYNTDSALLILGSFPSVLSRAADFYYGNPRNRFWQTLGIAAEERIPDDKDARISFLLAHGIALYDIIASCEANGSLDSSIKKIIAADLTPLLNSARISRILLNGRLAERVFMQAYPELAGIARYMPSTSPANISFDAGPWLAELKNHFTTGDRLIYEF